MFKPVIFREYDIRGIFNQQFDEDFAFQLGKAFATYVIKKTKVYHPKIVLGLDARLSSPKLSERCMKGICSTGAHVIYLGKVTTPITYFSTFFLKETHSAIMVTASHNPSEYNGFKIVFERFNLFGNEIQELYKIIQNKDFIEGKSHGKIQPHDIIKDYVEHYKKQFLQANLLKPLNFVIDCGNGAAGYVVRRLYESVGLKPHILFEKPDGTFPNHHPDPSVEKNLTSLKEEIQKTSAVVGFGFDGDADRIGVVDSNGKFIYGDELLAVISKDVLENHPQGKVIADVKCSDRLFNYIDQHGGQSILWKTGHSLIKHKIKEEKAILGGEISGHIFFADRNYSTDDALYVGLRLIEILSKNQCSIGELLKDFPPAVSTPEIRIDTTEEKKHLIVQKVKEKFPHSTSEYEVNFLDGIRIRFGQRGWALIRASNTQPALTLRFEAKDTQNLKNIEAAIYPTIQKYL